MALQTAPLAVIPYLTSETETRAQRRRRYLLLASLVAAFIIALLLINFLVTPLDVMWFKGMRKINQIMGE
jgi:succinoglycan biosynthesis transport protein ExoP